MTNIKESQILPLIRDGNDRLVVPLLYKNVLPLVKNYMGKHGGKRDDAEDVFHDVLLIFYEQVIENKFKDVQNVYGYLYRMCVFNWLTKLKKNRSIPLSEEYAALLPDHGSDISEENYITRDENLLKQLFSQIGEKCVELLTCVVYHDMLMEDIKLRMGFSSVEAVRMQHMRCRKKLIEEIEKRPSLMNILRGI